MDKFIITGGKPLHGNVKVAGAKNVAMKVILASLLTDEELTIRNIPLISSVLGTLQIVAPLGVKYKISGHILKLKYSDSTNYQVPLELGGLYRTAPMAMAPLLARLGKAVVPNPGGCRLGKRPIDRHIEALKEMGAVIKYRQGYFYAEGKLYGGKIKFQKNTHTGTETVLLGSVLAKGKTVIENAAEEPEVDDLIRLLNEMGARIQRQGRTILVTGVEKLHGVDFRIMYDRNEVVTYATAAIVTGGDVIVQGTQRHYIKAFLESLDQCGAGWEPSGQDRTRFYKKDGLKSSHIVTAPHPGFMTDWQAPWAVLATQATGLSTIHETVFESRFSYVAELKKMGAKITFFDPVVKDAQSLYNFNWQDRVKGFHQGIKILGPTPLHEAVLEITDLRAGATLVLAALAARGTSVLHGVEHIDRGYENFDKQLTKLGADIKRETVTI